MCVPVLLYTCGVGAMRTKPTLTIEKDVSSMDERSIPLKDLSSPITDSLVGMFEDSGKDYKAMLGEAFLERHP